MKRLFFVFALLMSASAIPVSVKAGNTRWTKFNIVLDPGHGGSDPGALGPQAPHEGTLALRCAKSLKQKLTELGAPVVMTRESDVDVSLTARQYFKATCDPWIFCSIHLNSAGTTNAWGTETYHYWTNNSNTKLAQYVQSSLINEMGRINRGVKTAQYTVIMGYSGVPAILTEGLFINNPNEWAYLQDENSDGNRNWINGHLYGFYDFLYNVQQAYGSADLINPREYFGRQPQINVSTESIHFDCRRGSQPSQEFYVEGKDLSDYIAAWSSNTDELEVTPAFLQPEGGTVRVTLKGTASDGWREHRVYIKSGDVSREVVVTAAITGEPLGAMEEKWVLSDKRGNKDSKGYDASKIRNFTYKDGKLYCVYNNEDILVIDAQTGDKLGYLRKNDITRGGTLRFCDVTNLGGTIIACNLAVSAAGDELRIYGWGYDEEEPYLLFNTTDFQGAPRLGDCMEVVGDFGVDEWYCFANDDESVTRIVEYNRNRGVWTSKHTKAYDENGNHLHTGSTTRAYPSNGCYWIDGNASHPAWVTWDRGFDGVSPKTYCETAGQTQGASHHEFWFHSHKYAVNLVFRGEGNHTGAKMRIMHDATGDFSVVDQHQEMPSDGLGDAQNMNGTGDCHVNTDGENFVEAWVVSTTQGLAYFTYGDVPRQSPAKVNQPAISFSERDMAVKAKVGETVTKKLYVDCKNLRGNIGFWIDGPAKDKYSIEPSSLDGPGEVSITYRPDGVNTDWVWIGAYSEDAADAYVDFHGSSWADAQAEGDVRDDELEARVGEWAETVVNFKARNLVDVVSLTIEENVGDSFAFDDPFAMGDEVTVYFDNNRARWDEVNVWILNYDDLNDPYLGVSWPGIPVNFDSESGFHKFTFTPKDKGHRLMVIFNNGPNHTKTEDCPLIPGAVYSAAGVVADRYPHALPALVDVDAAVPVKFSPIETGEANAVLVAKSSGCPEVRVPLKGMGMPGFTGVDMTGDDRNPLITSIGGGLLTVSGPEVDKLDLYDARGVKLISVEGTAVNISHLSPGIYVVIAVDRGGSVYRRKLEIR